MFKGKRVKSKSALEFSRFFNLRQEALVFSMLLSLAAAGEPVVEPNGGGDGEGGREHRIVRVPQHPPPPGAAKSNKLGNWTPPPAVHSGASPHS